MVYAGFDIGFDLLSVRPVKNAKTPNVKWLGEVKRVRGEIETNNVVLLAIVLKFGRFMTLLQSDEYAYQSAVAILDLSHC